MQWEPWLQEFLKNPDDWVCQTDIFIPTSLGGHGKTGNKDEV